MKTIEEIDAADVDAFVTTLSPLFAGAPRFLRRLAEDGTPELLSELQTDADGRIADLLDGGELSEGDYQLAFDVGGYAHDPDAFFQSAALALRITDAHRSYHVPLLLSPFGMSTYRGS